jgi:hypothetical protein
MNEASQQKTRPKRTRKRWPLRVFLFLFVAALLWWTLRRAPLQEAWNVLKGLTVLQIFLLITVNGLIVLMLSSRWWLILRTQGSRVSYLSLVGYSMSSFSVSYFTPGPQLGGEPLQIWAVHKRHQVPVSVSVASVSLDKLLEVIANSSFLTIGMAVILASPWRPAAFRDIGLPLAILLLIFPLAYLILMLTGQRPLAFLTGILPSSWQEKGVLETIRESEAQVSRFCTEFPLAVLQATFLSILIWFMLVGEYWLTLSILGLPLNLAQAISALVAARLAFLTPMPGGLGALEAGQTLAVSALGFEPSFGISISLLIRARDLFLGGAGLWLAASQFGTEWLTQFGDKISEISADLNRYGDNL